MERHDAHLGKKMREGYGDTGLDGRNGKDGQLIFRGLGA